MNRYIEKTNTTLSKKGFESGRILNEGSVLFVSIGSTIGKVAQTKEKSTTNQQINAIEVNENNNNNFIYSLLEKHSNNIRVGASTQAVPILNKTSFSLLEFNMPKIIEQEKIGELFTNLDNLITLHQRKFNDILAYKLGVKLIFIKFNKNVWEQRKLEDITQIIMGQSPDSINYTNNSDDTILIQGNADLNNGIVVPRIWSSQITKKSYPNDIIFTVRAPVGEIARNPYFATIGRGVASFKGNDFLYQTLIQKKENNYWNNISAGSTFDSINSEQLKNVIIDLPKNDAEQDKIGELFTNLDNLITLHQRKYTYIFYSWEQRKLANLINEYKETVTSDCTLPVLTSSKVDGVVLQEEHFGRKQNHDITGYNILPYGYCTYRNRSDGIDFTFNINKCCKMGIISKFYPVFYGNKNNINLISIILNNSKEVAREIGYTCSGTGQKVLSFLDLQKMNIIIPNRSEQDKISDLFDNLDNLITLHQHKELKRRNDNNEHLRW